MDLQRKDKMTEMDLQTQSSQSDEMTAAKSLQHFKNLIHELKDMKDYEPKSAFQQALHSRFMKSNTSKAPESISEVGILEKDKTAFLEEIGGVFLVINVAEKLCICADLSSHEQVKKLDLINKHLVDFVHPEDVHHFLSSINSETISSSSITDGKELLVDVIKPITFNCRFLSKSSKSSVSKGAEDDEDVNYITTECIGLAHKVDQRSCDTICEDFIEHPYFLCLSAFQNVMSLASPQLPTAITDTSIRGPPNLTINTRVEIPQPFKFFTRQDINKDDEIIVMNINRCASGNSWFSTERQELIDRCLKSLQEPRYNGNSLKQILLKQVLSKSQSTSQTYKFQLKDGTYVTALTKCKLVGAGHSGQPPFIMSEHIIYRDGTIRGLDFRGLPLVLKNILPDPVVMETSTDNCQGTTTTIATLAANNSTVLDRFRSSSHYPSTVAVSSVDINLGSSTSYVSGGLVSKSTRPMNVVEVAQQFLASTGANCDVEAANKVVSPPPHLNGHLVHAVSSGIKSQAYLNELLKTASSGPMKSELDAKKSSSEPTVSSADSKDTLTDGTFSATFPGPPCVEPFRHNSSKKDGNFINQTPTSSIKQIFVSGMTSMRNKASIAITTCNMVLNTDKGNGERFDKNSLLNTRSSLRGRVRTPPENTSCSYQPTAVRPRSASTHTGTSPGKKSLKRSLSMLSQDGGIGEIVAKPVRKIKKDNVILKQLLCSNDGEVDKSLVSTSLSNPRKDTPSVSVQSSCPLKVTETASKQVKSEQVQPTSSNGVQSNIQTSGFIKSESQTTFNLNAPSTCCSLYTPISSSSYTQSNAIFLENLQLSNVANSAPVSRPLTQHQYSVSTAVSAKEIEELTEILNDFEEDSPTFQASSNPVLNEYSAYQSQLSNASIDSNARSMPDPLFDQNLVLDDFWENNQNDLPVRSNSLQGLAAPTLNQTHLMTSPVSMSQSSLSVQQPMNVLNNLDPPIFDNIVPTGQEMCPNRVVSSAGMISPRLLQPQPASQYREYVPPDNWEGDEPLVDLGAYPPPAGLDPRKAIPIPPGMNTSLNGGNIMKMRTNNSMQINMQNGENRLAFSNPSPRMMSMHLINTQRGAVQQQNLSPSQMSSISPANLQPMHSGLSNFRPMYSNQHMQQHGIVANNNNARIPFFRQQQQQMQTMQSGFDNNMTGTGETPQYSYNQPVGPRMGVARPNGVLMRQRRIQDTAPDLQHAISPSSGLNPTRFIPHQQIPMGNYSPIKSPNFPSNNHDLMKEDLRPSMGYRAPIHPTNNIMRLRHPSQYNGAMGGAYNGPTSMVLPNQQLGLDRVTGTVPTPVTKATAVKRARIRKPRKNSKAKLLENTSEVFSTQGQTLQMTTGDMLQRAQVTYNPQHYDVPRPMISSVDPILSSQQGNSNAQRLNLNLKEMLSQHKAKNDYRKFPVDNPPNGSSPHGMSNNFSMTSSAPFPWNSVDSCNRDDLAGISSNFTNGHVSDISCGGMSTNLFAPSLGIQGDSALSEASILLPVIGSSGNGITINSNLNNNNETADLVTSPYRYTGSISTAPIHSPNSVVGSSSNEPMTSPTPRSRRKSANILKSLLL